MDGEMLHRCLMYDVNYTEILRDGLKRPDPTWQTIHCKNGWEYNSTEVPYSTIAIEVSPKYHLFHLKRFREFRRHKNI